MVNAPGTGTASASLPTAALVPRLRHPRHWLPQLAMGILAIASLIFLLQAFFHFIRLRRVQSELIVKQSELKREQQRLADWRQKAAFAESPDFLDSAVKELTLTRDPSEIEIQVTPSPVPPVGDIR